MAINLRVLHRALVPFASVPLLLTAFTGALYSVLRAMDIQPPFWVMRLHIGRFGMLNLKPWYSVLLAVCTLVLVFSGLGMYALPSRRRARAAAAAAADQDC